MMLNDYTIDKSPAKTHSKEYIKYFIMKHFFTPGLFIVLLVSLYSCQSGNNNEKRLREDWATGTWRRQTKRIFGKAESNQVAIASVFAALL